MLLYTEQSRPEFHEAMDRRHEGLDFIPAAPHDHLESDERTLLAIGRLVCAWGTLECQLEQKIAHLRGAAGGSRMTAARIKPSMGKMLAELRAIISMRDRRNNAQIAQIAEIERSIQMIDKFRTLVIQGFFENRSEAGQGGESFLCRDLKNNVIPIGLAELEEAIAGLDSCREDLLAL